MYIAGSFKSLKSTTCKPNKEWTDNDPHIWNKPYSWGICRYDLRNGANIGDYVFFILPKSLPKDSKLKQMIFCYIKIKDIISHKKAYKLYKRKRMEANKNPNGNILVDNRGRYTRYDRGSHNFNKIKERYAIADMNDSLILKDKDIAKKSEHFVSFLQKLLGKKGDSVFKLVSRKGRILNEKQVKDLKYWLKNSST